MSAELPARPPGMREGLTHVAALLLLLLLLLLRDARNTFRCFIVRHQRVRRSC
jgi:hypothetical protein